MTTPSLAVDARELFRAAYENRYTWDEHFPGFTADLTLTRDGQTYGGQVIVNKDLSYEVLGVADEQAKKEMTNFVWEVVTHRRHTPFDKAHGKNSFTLGATDETGATEILVSGDAMGSNYKIRNREICEVSRVMNGVAFVIHHKHSLDTGNGYISTGYDIVYRNAETGEITQRKSVELTFEKIDNYYMLTSEVVQGEEQGKPFGMAAVFSNIQYLA